MLGLLMVKKCYLIYVTHNQNVFRNGTYLYTMLVIISKVGLPASKISNIYTFLILLVEFEDIWRKILKY